MVLLYLERLDEDPGCRKFKLFNKYNIHLVSPVKFQTIVGSCLIKEYWYCTGSYATIFV
jgi:hypothetical protein